MIANVLYPSLLQGVSQQVPRERVGGQLTEQLNMLSDPVTGLRRRPGFKFSAVLDYKAEDISFDSLYSQYMELNDKPVHLFINTKTGRCIVTDKEFETLLNTSNDYLKAPNASYIKATNSFGLGWILNTSKKPTKVSNQGLRNPANDGFIEIKSGAFLKDYTFQVLIGSTLHQITYSTPTGEATGDAGRSSPEGVAKEIENKLRGIGVQSVTREGPVVFLTDNRGIRTSNLSGSNYASASNSMRIDNIAMIPPKLPSGANGAVCAVGTSSVAMQYYKWNYETLTWIECGAYGSISSLGTMPLELRNDNGTIKLNAVPFEGRISGDEENNPTPHFIDNGITGIGTFMGRLVILSGSKVSLSASRYPTRFYRSTVTSILDSDPVEVSVGSASSASFEHCVQFNKDLVVFASTHQAVIPVGNSALTPTNAMLVLTSEQSIDNTAKPCVVGKTLMYSSPLSDLYFGIGELTPSEYTSSIYTPQNLTDHIPHYFQGRCRHIVSGGSINVCLLTSTTERNNVYVHEYFWAGSERQLMSWHKWSTPLPVCSVHYSSDKFVVCLLGHNKEVVLCTLDPRSSQTTVGGVQYLDCSIPLTVDYSNPRDPFITLPGWLVASDNNEVACTNTTSGLEGESVGITKVQGSQIHLDRSYKNKDVIVGWKFLSAIIPNSPIVTNADGRIISDSKSTLVKSTVTVQHSGEFFCDVSDERNTKNDKLLGNHESALHWSSRELGLGSQQIATTGDIVIPCRTHAHTTNLRLYTSGTREMNIINIENAVRLHYNKNRHML